MRKEVLCTLFALLLGGELLQAQQGAYYAPYPYPGQPPPAAPGYWANGPYAAPPVNPAAYLPPPAYYWRNGQAYAPITLAPGMRTLPPNGVPGNAAPAPGVMPPASNSP